MAKSTQLRGLRAREAILDTARKQFMDQGFRNTSIESIATKTGVARPTVYAHFSSKDDIFRTIVGELHDERLAAMQAAARSSASLSERLYAALSARFVPFVEITAASAFGSELLDENSRVCSDILQAARRQSLDLLENVLAEADAAGEISLADADLDEADAASILYDAARGPKEEATITPEAYEKQLRRLVRVLSRGLGAHLPAPHS
ncbi:TetR/AcrR family transcriptional regulator [Nocardioides sp. 1609]|uniref:TetR/AcrR family transcriptional regulator n=1 Tax=Nocardioides sp. 1609 TaxID=2508327 RepID=UPI00106F1B51|nr:TetR/AcrR family transcriptional regulator [Nocardioides sp. 1609]